MAAMGTMNQPTDWREGRRLRAWALHLRGWKQQAIAEALGVTQGAVSQWIARGKAGGQDALRNRKSPGAPRRLTTDQRAQLPTLLARGAEAFGFRGDVWTRARIATVIKREFGVSYHPDHIGRLLQEVGWTNQKPEERATQRDEDAIAQWRAEHWPAIKKRLPTKGAPSSG
jgi:transposase